jgi:hypothetical protein
MDQGTIDRASANAMNTATHYVDFEAEFYGAVRQGIKGARLVKHVRIMAPWWSIASDADIKAWSKRIEIKVTADNLAAQAADKARAARFNKDFW